MGEEACGEYHSSTSQLYITRLKGSEDKIGICPACGEVFDKDDFPEIETMKVSD